MFHVTVPDHPLNRRAPSEEYDGYGPDRIYRAGFGIRDRGFLLRQSVVPYCPKVLHMRDTVGLEVLRTDSR